MGRLNACSVMSVLFMSLLSSEAKSSQCEVCVGVLNKVSARLKNLPSGEASSEEKIREVLRSYCSEKERTKEGRLCYAIGASEQSAISVIGDVSKPLSYGKPVERICDELNRKNPEICLLQYDKQIDLDNTDLRKLKIRDLRKVLTVWGESCKNCLEKSEYIEMIERLKPKYAREEL